MTEDIERALRDSLARHAQQAPNGIALAEQIIATTRPSVVGAPRARQWRAWTLPLIAAGSVAAVALTVFGVGQLGHQASPRPGASLTNPATHSTSPAPSPTSSAPTPSPAPSSSVSSTPSAVSPPVNPVGLWNFKLVDMTFMSEGQDEWAIGTSNCTTGPGTCAAMVYSSDGGVSWHSMKQPTNANVTTAECSGCIDGIRFASSKVGYAFGPSTFYMTQNGGQSWQLETGGAYALEAADGNVVRVQTQCFGGCPITVRTAPVGSTDWHTVALPGGGATGMDTGLTLQRQSQYLYLLVYGHLDGGSSTAYSTLYRSSDNGASWTKHADDPCPQVGATEYDSTAIGSGGLGVAVLCTPRIGGGSSFVAVSTDFGRTFHAGGLTALGTKADTAIAVASPNAIVVFGPDTQRSIDQGKNWHPIGNASLNSGSITFVGFETKTDGRVVDNGGRTILTTKNAGQTWTAYTFPEK